MNLDQSDIGRPDPQSFPLDLVGCCEYQGCRQPIYFGEDCVNLDGELFCEDRCLTKHLGGRRVQAGVDM